jgi:hypothetical protein
MRAIFNQLESYMWPISGADPGGIECSSRYGQIFPIMDSKIVLGENSPLIAIFSRNSFLFKISENLSLLR